MAWHSGIRIKVRTRIAGVAFGIRIEVRTRIGDVAKNGLSISGTE
jgi:hypothetical protein